MKVAKVLGGFGLACISLAIACSSEGHELGGQVMEAQGTPRCEDFGKAEGRPDVRSYCVEYTYDSCANGAWVAKYGWGDTPRWTCGDDVTLGCCMPGHGIGGGFCVQGYGGQCLPYSQDGCHEGRWLPKSAANCGEGQGCCTPVSCVQGHAGQCLPYSQDGCQDGRRWLPETVTDCAEGQSCCAPWPDDG